MGIGQPSLVEQSAQLTESTDLFERENPDNPSPLFHLYAAWFTQTVESCWLLLKASEHNLTLIIRKYIFETKNQDPVI
jgi:hypothetical protein